MSEKQTKVIDEIRQDLNNARAALAFGLDLNDNLINGIWRFFTDVEINVPLAIMPLEKKERTDLARGILDEMDEIMAKIKDAYAQANDDAAIEKIHRGPLGLKVDSLWKELAGCYAEIVNNEIPQLPDHVKDAVAQSIVEELARNFDATEDEIMQRIRTDSSIRMLFRRTGINPDDIIS